MKDVASRIANLCSQSGALPGTGGSLSVMKQPSLTTQQTTSATNAAGEKLMSLLVNIILIRNAAKTMLDVAAHRLDTASKTLTSTMDNFTAMSEKLVDVQIKLSELRDKVAEFKAQEKTLVG